MKYIEPPENLPVVPSTPAPNEPSKPNKPESKPSDDDVHFRDRGAGDIVEAPPTGGAARGATSVPAPRSLQPIRIHMADSKGRSIRAPDDLLTVDDVAERLVLSRAAVYRFVRRKLLPVYRLPSGIRLKAKDVDAYLDSVLTEAESPKRYGRQEDQR